MSTVALIRRLWEHAVWADDLLATALGTSEVDPGEAWREYAHILGAEEVWLARLEARAPRAPVWPSLTADDAARLRTTIRVGFASVIARSTDATLDAFITYRNSAGKEFTSRVSDVLAHVALHGQYHRGKINMLLRQHAREPVPTDFIAFVRGAPAAVAPGTNTSA